MFCCTVSSYPTKLSAGKDGSIYPGQDAAGRFNQTIRP
jgi:hypothetical protein